LRFAAEITVLPSIIYFLEIRTMDSNIQATADDAIHAKYAAVQAGYYSDDFIEPFYSSTLMSRRRQVQPIIKRGTHARVCCMDRAITGFCQTTANAPRRQIVVVGCGKDTSYFRYCNGSIIGLDEGSTGLCDWFEIDHARVIQEKAEIIKGSPMLSQHFPFQPSPHGFTSIHPEKQYYHHLIEHDLRGNPDELFEKLNLNKDLPTLFIMECVLMYLPEDASKSLIRTIKEATTNQTWVVAYEPKLEGDAFGHMMQHNLIQARVANENSCLCKIRTLSKQLEQFIGVSGYHRAIGADMWSSYQTVLTQAQRSRANQCEFLDEMEEWMLIMKHYCFLVATTSQEESDHVGLSSIGASSPLGFLQNSCQVKEASVEL
jgi:O-methyltransferase involved in polyketide biosynthesis